MSFNITNVSNVSGAYGRQFVDVTYRIEDAGGTMVGAVPTGGEVPQADIDAWVAAYRGRPRAPSLALCVRITPAWRPADSLPTTARRVMSSGLPSRRRVPASNARRCR